MPALRFRADRLGRAAFLCTLSVSVLMTLVAATPVAAQQTGTNVSENDESPSPYEDFRDFVHFARIGRFDAARAVGQRLLENRDLNPVKLLQTAEAEPRGIDTLLLVIRNTEIAETAQKILEVIRAGEEQLRKDPGRIKLNIRKLGGPPQEEYNAIQRLKDSGEYAVPWLLQALTDAERKNLWPRLVRVIPQLGRKVVTPLALGLQIENESLQATIARALGDLGYAEAVPYIQKLLANEDITRPVRTAARNAIKQIERTSGRRFANNPAATFTALAEQYYNEVESVAADPRLPKANVWYVRDGFLTAVSVPIEIFGPIMAMRTTDQALAFDPNRSEAIALWLAANIRREARLGMDVESGEPSPKAADDPTTPDGFPRSIYFSSTAGPRYCHPVLARAIDDGDAPVALGAIAALRATAGATSLIDGSSDPQPLVRALEFPDRLVRIKAAIALASALPQEPFTGSDLVPPVLSETMRQSSVPQYVVIEPDKENLNRIMSALRDEDAKVIGEARYYEAMTRAREELDHVTGIVMATDAGAPDLAGAIRKLRTEYVYARTPVVLLVKPAHRTAADQLARGMASVTAVESVVGEPDLTAALAEATRQVGRVPLSEEQALSLALEMADVLRKVALNEATVIDVKAAQPALLTALNQEVEELQIKAGAVLALVDTPTAQQAIATLALDTENTESLRMAMLSRLAESAKANGNNLTSQQVDALIQMAADEPRLGLRTAASKALGALNLSDNRASTIIRNYHPR